MFKWTTLLTMLVFLLVGAAVIAQEEAYNPNLDPANFVAGVNHSYFTLTPGTTLIYLEAARDGTERIEVSVMPETRRILGIRCMVVRDSVWLDGVLIEDTYDWYAQDRDGNVWYMGEDTKEYEDGEVVSTAGSWEGGVDGAQPGIIMKADLEMGDTYRQEYYAGEAEDMAQIIGLDNAAVVGDRTYEQLLVTREWTPLEPGVAEQKYYAPGVGLVLTEVVEGGSGRSELVGMTTWEIDSEDIDDTDEAFGETPVVGVRVALEAAEASFTGEVIAREAELGRQYGRLIYRLTFGNTLVTVDAINGAVRGMHTGGN